MDNKVKRSRRIEKDRIATSCFFPVFSVTSLVFVLLVAYSSTALADSGGVQTSISVDIVSNAFARQKEPSTKLQVREAEVFFYAPIDQTFDGILGIAAHQEKGAALFEIHEATIGSSKLIPWSRFRIGQYFLGLGKLNSTHRHDWPFTSAPRVHLEFFGEEGVDDTGVEYSVLPPLPFTLDLTIGLTNGWKFGHAHTAGEEPKTPTHYARLVSFAELPWDGGLQLGLNYLGRRDSKGTKTQLAGIDLTTKWREGKSVPFFLQGEIWHRWLAPAGVESTKSLGYYAFPQVSLIGSLSLGLRCDGYTVLNLEDATGKKETNFADSYAPTLTWKPSEFSTFRVAYQWDIERSNTKSSVSSSFLQAQTTFIIGAHPAHDF